MMKMSDYTDEINKIVPSESFISETEILMKKALADRKRKKSSEMFPRRIVVRTLSAAAVLVLTVTAVSIYTKDPGISTQEKNVADNAADVDATETAAETSVSDIEEAAVPETAADIMQIADTEAVTSVTVTEQPVVTAVIEEAENIVTSESAAAVITEQTSAAVVTTVKSEETGIPAVTTTAAYTSYTSHASPAAPAVVTEPAAVPSVPETSAEVPAAAAVQETDTAAEQPQLTESKVVTVDYDDLDEVREEEYEEYEEFYAEPYGGVEVSGVNESPPPLYVHSLDNGTGDDDDYFEEDYAGNYYTSGVTAYNASYRLDNSEIFIISSAEEIYVPDTLDMLEDGDYSAEITAGFDEYDPLTGTVIGGTEKTIDSTDTQELHELCDCITDICGGSKALHSDRRSEMTDYRYRITVYSAGDDDSGTVMFEIMYNDDMLVVNRYDNGTESSEKYYLSAADYNTVEDVVAQCMI